MHNAAETAKAIRKSVAKTKAYDNGTVIAWDSLASATGITYSYAAVFANGQWYTTIARDNTHVQKLMSNEALMEYFGRNENVRNVRVADTFVEVAV